MITQTFNIHLYHWAWYLFGFIFAPRLTVMIFVTIYCREILPVWLIVWGWIIAVVANSVEATYTNREN